MFLFSFSLYVSFLFSLPLWSFLSLSLSLTAFSLSLFHLATIWKSVDEVFFRETNSPFSVTQTFFTINAPTPKEEKKIEKKMSEGERKIEKFGIHKVMKKTEGWKRLTIIKIKGMSNKFLKFSASGLEKSKKDRIMKCLIKKATKRYVCAKN